MVYSNPAAAQENIPTDNKSHVQARLVTDVQAVTRGDTFHAGVLFVLEPGWHMYWQYPGDAGFATELQWHSGDAIAGPVAWPAPQVFREADGVVTYGYQDEVLLFSNMTVSDSVGQTIELKVNVHFLLCNIICSPASVQLKEQIAVLPQAIPADAATLQLFAQYQQQVPSAAASQHIQYDIAYSQNNVRPGDHFLALLRLRHCTQDSCAALQATDTPFVPYGTHPITWQLARVLPDPANANNLAILLHVYVPTDVPINEPLNTWHGVLRLAQKVDGTLLPPFEISGHYKLVPTNTPIETNDDPLFLTATEQAPLLDPMAIKGSWRRALKALAMAFLGGLVLNLMPCVLPVLAIKVLGIAHLQQAKRRAVIQHGIAYTIGIVGSLLLLASLVIGLKTIGIQVGWGFQFQEPRFVVVVACCLMVLALNCFGVFEFSLSSIRLGADKPLLNLERSVLDGMLAVALSTPCSGPFLGVAVAYALTQAAWLIALVFVAVGLGLALPYVLLTLLPQLRRFIPKPGPWMLHLKTLLGFGLLANTLWLVWIIGRTFNNETMVQLLVVLWLAALLTWIYGQMVQPHRSPTWPWLLGLLAILLGTGPYIMNLDETHAASTEKTLSTAPYSEQAVATALNQGHAVFVDFTADWCITCKYNEQHVLNHASITEAFAKHHIVLLKADYTRRDPHIQKLLATFGRAGVPMYLLYTPAKPNKPTVLPEILTVGYVLNCLQNVGFIHTNTSAN